ncbi:MAG TPA: hypothetical protein DD490_05025 [Acidobacteria bacterium]|nr:hypothetical protein [Acidobacteriota bacterium]
MDKKEKAQAAAQEILTAFEEGSIPKALARMFVHRNHDVPCRSWSFSNRLLAALRGHFDARGYRQWQEVGRFVKAGERSFSILVPCMYKAKEDDPAREIQAGDLVVKGFATAAVFGYRQTDGEPLPGEAEEEVFVDSLPVVEVARSWGIEIVTYSGRVGSAQGFFTPGQIGLGVRNLGTFAHELIHAADHRLSTITHGRGQQLDNEIVAEFGGAVLLECLGFTSESDRGGAFAYIEGYCRKHSRPLIAAVTELVDRTCNCVALILETADQLQPAEPAEEREVA